MPITRERHRAFAEADLDRMFRFLTVVEKTAIFERTAAPKDHACPAWSVAGPELQARTPRQEH